MAALATQSITRAGLSAAYASAAGGGDTMVPSASTFLHVKNTGSSTVVTIAATAVPARDMVVTNLTVTVGATTGDKMIGPIRADVFANATTGLAAITYSQVTGITVGVFEMVPG